MPNKVFNPTAPPPAAPRVNTGVRQQKMSISYELYNAPSKYAQMNEWGKDESLPIAKSQEVKDKIMRLYPRIKQWNRYEDNSTSPLFDYPVRYFALGVNNCSIEEEYLDITISEHRDGYIHFISVRKGSPKLVRELLEEFQLRYVFEMQSCRLIDPYKYVDNWMPLSTDKNL